MKILNKGNRVRFTKLLCSNCGKEFKMLEVDFVSLTEAGATETFCISCDDEANKSSGARLTPKGESAIK